MRSLKRRALYLASAMLAMPALSAPAMAQDAPDDTKSGGVKEIVVTAQRQAESVLEVPLSIQALSADQLTNSGIQQMSDLQLTTPGFTPSNASGYNQMFIRGIGNSIFVGADPSVATFIDDVPRIFGTLVNNFVDVERVEVIKGAPGALYGRNATGGAINIITRQPDTEQLSAKFKVSYGTKDTVRASGFGNIPMGDKVALTIAAELRKHDGYVKNLTPSPTAFTADMFPVNDVVGPGTASIFGTPQQTADFLNSGNSSKSAYSTEDFWAVSTKLLVKPTDRLKITLAADYSRKNDDNGNGLYNETPEFATGALLFYLNNFIGASATSASLSPLNVHVTQDFATAQRGDGYVKLRDYGVSGTAVYSLDSVDITSITAYRENKSRFQTELGFTPFNFLAAGVDIDKSTFYQEFRAVSNLDGPLSYIAGASYLQAKFDGGLVTDLLHPVPFLADLPSGSGKYTVDNWSAYLQLGYDFTDNLNLTVSGRYINETNKAVSFNGLTGTQDPFTLKEKKFLPSATLKYSLDGGGNVYLRWARGFKAGGIVPVVPVTIFPDPFTQGGVFKGEEVDTFEGGFRAPLFDNNLQVTAAVFYNDYRNVQVGAHARATPIPGYGSLTYQSVVSIAVVNAGSAETYGAEASLTARVADPLTVGASVGYLKAKYKSLEIANNPVLEDLDLTGRRMINSPKWQLSFHADLDQPVSDDWRVVGNVLASYTDDVIWQHSGFTGVLNDSIGPSYWLVNARLGLKTTDDTWELAAYVKNAFNEGYTTFGNSAAGYGNILTWGDPRIYGLELTANF